MAKNITIAEGGVGRNFGSTTKLKTDLMGGGTQYWIPEDEAGDYVTKRHLNVTQNGTYTPEDGFYDEVTVSVAINEETYGIDPYTGTISTLVTDPEDGEKYIVSVEPDGTITKTLFPTKMVITTPPAKTSYTEGETMDYTGIVCTLYDKAGNVFTDGVYTTGVIPFSELEFPVYVAPNPTGPENSEAYAGDMTLEFPENDPITIVEGVSGRSEWPSQGTRLGYVYNIEGNGVTGVCHRDTQNNFRVDLYSRSNFGVGRNWGNVGTMPTPEITGYANYVQDEVVGDYYWTHIGSSGEVPPFPTMDYIGVSYSTRDFALQIFGGTIVHAGAVDIPVQWAAPQPHFPVKAKFQEYFEIEVTNI